MSNKIISIKPTETIADASKLMKANRISCLPVMDDGKKLPTGIITTTDLVNIYTSATKERHIDPWDEVSKFMSTPVVTVSQDETVSIASNLMRDKKFHHLIVIDDSGSMVGVLSTLDIARVLE